MTDKLNLSDAEWREKLTPEQYHVLREGGTERAFTGKYESNKQSGLYKCAGCGAPRHADCGSCECDTRPVRGAQTCAECRIEQPAHLFSRDPQHRVCNDCR